MTYPPNSRYHNVETTTLEDREGREVVYLKRRFVPPPERFALLLEHTVSDGERLDNIAARYLGDSQQDWKIADANRAMNPSDLLTPVGRSLRITLPEGIPTGERDA